MMKRPAGKLFAPLVRRGGWVYAGPVKLFRLMADRGTVQLVDGDTRRARRRGTPLIEVSVRELCALLEDEMGSEIFYNGEGEA